METNNKIDYPFARVEIISPGLLLNFVKEGATIGIEEIREIKKANLSLTKGEKYVILVKSGDFSTITKEARKLSASNEFVQNTIAKAFVVNNLGHSIVGNIYLKFDKPFIKTRIFSDEADAIHWLMKQLENRNL